jgi:UDP-N-acetylglucosamine--N-acetylmuramyl-(pentapeptide) pyrophosphoryl-undecaprenol N-acetylglucosamine transferase
VYPALAVLQALGNEAEVLWVGGEGGMEEQLVKRESISFTTIPAAGLHGVGLRSLPGNLWTLGRGYLAARKALADFRPDALFFTGGFVAAPVALAGRKLPTLIYVPDIEPALALSLVSRFADRIAVTTEDSRAFYRDTSKVTVTGYPTRREMHGWDKKRAYEIFDLSPQLPTLLVFGGSKGARAINRALMPVLPQLLDEMQVIHVSGAERWEETQAEMPTLSGEQERRYHAYPYLHSEMGTAMAAADLVVARAGASTLGEFPLFGLPAILAPLAFAWRYQKTNADYLAQRGAALALNDEDLKEQLLPSVLDLMRDEQKRAKMAGVMRSLARPEAAADIAGLLKSMVKDADSRRKMA